MDHGFDIDLQWWQSELDTAGFQSKTKLAQGGPENSLVLRRDLFKMADEVRNESASVEDFAFMVLVWGSGPSRRNNRARIRTIIGAQPRALKAALDLSLEDRMASFKAFRNKGRNLFPFLGPSFFSKLMYFYGAGDPSHGAPIVDLRVLRALSRTEAGKGIYVGFNYGPQTYARACTIMEDISSAALTSKQAGLKDCSPDVVERWAFEAGKPA